MKRDAEVRIVERLLDVVEGGLPVMEGPDFKIPVSRYTSQARFEAERDVLFRQYPLAVAHCSEVANPGDFITLSALGVPILLARGADGQLRAFLNVCRHRGTMVVSEPCGHGKKAFVCPYHNWTYDLAGALTHIPQEFGFPSVDRKQYGLVPLPVESRFGLVWLRPSPKGAPLDLASYLGAMAEDLEDLAMDSHFLYRRVTDVKKTNWKLIMDAFLESYHIRALHRASVSPFFLDNVAIAEQIPPHIRAAVARKSIFDSRSIPPTEWNFRAMVSMALFLFPNTILVLHPDYVSQLSFIPLDPDTTHYTHTMLVPSEPRIDKERLHWERSFELAEKGVFQREDLATAESIQAGLRSGANEALTFGRFEHGIRTFHGYVDAALAGR